MRSPARQFAFQLSLAAAVAAEAGAADKASVSPKIKAAVISGLPAFAPPAPKPATAPFWTKRIPADNDVLELPTMIVQERKFRNTDLQTLKGKTEEYMNAYLGAKDGLDRGVLNKHSANLNVGPGTLALFGAMTNEDRALEARFDDQRLQHRDDLLTTANVLEIADPEKAKWLRAQSRDLFYRKPDIRQRR